MILCVPAVCTHDVGTESGVSGSHAPWTKRKRLGSRVACPGIQ